MNRWMMLMLLLLAGCNVGPTYVAPDPDVPSDWHCEQAQELQRDSIDCFHWWESFNDPVLNCLINRAFSQNLDLHIAITRILEARLSLKGVQASYLPHVDGSLSYSYATFNQKTLNNILGFGNWCHSGQRNLNLFEVGFDAEWELDLFKMGAYKAESLKAMAESVEEEFSNVWVTLSAEVARSYIELRGFQQSLNVLNAHIEAQKDTVELTRSLAVGGFTDLAVMLQADETLSVLISRKPQLEYMIQKNIHHLSILLGYLPEELYCELSPQQSLPLLPCYRPIGLPSELLRRRPDIRKAERDLAAANAEVGVAVAALFPRISLTGFIGEITTFCTKGSLTGFIGPQVLLPIFNSKMLKQDVCLNKIKVEQSLYQYQKTVLEAFEETENAIAAFHFELEKNQSLLYARNSGQNAYYLTLQLYQSGFKNYLDVQTVHRAFLEAESAWLQSQVDLLVHYISLYKALGGGWDAMGSGECVSD